ncbi:MAG: AMP-binding protein, partial [Chryseobacterium sp.]|nr:AMP-binding protein [Chryseobacterium sp.]
MTIDFKNLNTNKLQPKTDFEDTVLLFLKEWFSEAPTVSVQTSGSTGIPKIFDIEKDKMRNSAKMTCDFLGLEEGHTALLCLPVEYISGKMMIVRALERNLKLIVKTPDTQPLKNLEEKVDFCAMTPLQVENALGKIHLIKNLVIGGAAVSETLKKKLSGIENKKNDNRRVFETYGMSETL